MLVLPSSTMPASLSLRTTVASYGGMYSLSTLLEAVVRMPLVEKLSLIERGIPRSGKSLPLARFASASLAFLSASSSVIVTNAWIFGSTCLIRSRYAFVSSTEEYFFCLRSSSAVVIVRFVISILASFFNSFRFSNREIRPIGSKFNISSIIDVRLIGLWVREESQVSKKHSEDSSMSNDKYCLSWCGDSGLFQEGN